MTTTNLSLAGAAHIHTPGFIKRLLARTDVRVTHVWDHDAARAARRAAELGAQTVANAADLWRDDAPKNVIVCSETNWHEKLVSPAALARKNLFVEKPLGFAGDDAQRMARAIAASGAVFSTGYFQRGNPINQFLKEHIAKGSFGRVTRARKSNCHAGSLGGWFDSEWRWMADPAQAGCGAFGDLGTHALDLLMWWLGPVQSATANLSVVTGRYGNCDETGEGMLRFANGTIATLAAGWVDVADPVQTVISGTEGHAHVVNNMLFFHSKHVEGADGKTPWTALPTEWPHAFENWLDAICGKAHAPLVSPVECAARNTVMDALHAGHRQGEWVELSS
jgi:predicted dehydrogenase